MSFLSRSLHSLLLLSFFFIGVSSCKKKADEQAAADYSPLTAGSTWTYQTNGGQTYTLTATSRDTVALGRTYKVLTNSAGPNNYMAKSGADYYRFGVLPGIGANGFEELYLKDGQAVNAVWQATQTVTVPTVPLPLTVLLKYTLQEKGINRTVAGKAFSNVQHVKLDISVALLGSVGSGDFYYAPGVGRIENTLLLNLQGQTSSVSESLVAYTIK